MYAWVYLYMPKGFRTQKRLIGAGTRPSSTALSAALGPCSTPRDSLPSWQMERNDDDGKMLPSAKLTGLLITSSDFQHANEGWARERKEKPLSKPLNAERCPVFFFNRHDLFESDQDTPELEWLGEIGDVFLFTRVCLCVFAPAKCKQTNRQTNKRPNNKMSKSLS